MILYDCIVSLHIILSRVWTKHVSTLSKQDKQFQSHNILAIMKKKGYLSLKKCGIIVP